MSVGYDKEINKETSWDGDESTHHLPVKGRRIEEFLKKELNNLDSENKTIKSELDTEKEERTKKSVSTFPQSFSREEKATIKENIDFDWHDDGTGNLVPVKHPDLSTQPSILPYKFAGNYVYEQMFYIPAPIVTAGDYYKTLNRDVKGNIIILDHSLCLVDAKGYTRSGENYFICCFDTDDIAGDESEYLEGLCVYMDNTYPNNLNSIIGAWVRVVWSAAPKINNDYYYYQQQKDVLTIYNNTKIAVTIGFRNDGVYPTNQDMFYYMASGESIVLDKKIFEQWIANELPITLFNSDGSGMFVEYAGENHDSLGTLGSPNNTLNGRKIYFTQVKDASGPYNSIVLYDYLPSVRQRIESGIPTTMYIQGEY